MIHQHVTKVHNQHNSVVTTVPLNIRANLELKAGDFLLWQENTESNFVQISKVVAGGSENVRDSRNSDRKD